jgi:hypothetical protein
MNNQTIMKKLSGKLVGGFLLGAVMMAGPGCESMGPNASQGAAVGVISGAVIGGIIGHQSGEGAEGAAVGAAAGGVYGGIVGNEKDQEIWREETERENARWEQENRKNDIVEGRSIDDSDLEAARKRAEAAEAELESVRREQQEAIRRARVLEEYEAREAEARTEAEEVRRAESGEY